MNKLFMPAIAAATVAFSFTCVGADTPVEPYSGTISIPSGTTYRMSALTNYSAATFSLSGGTLDVNGQAQTIAALSGDNPASVVRDSVGGAVLTVSQSDASEYVGNIDKSVILIKKGSATATYVLRDLGPFRAQNGKTIFAGGAITNASQFTIGYASGTSATVAFSGGQHKIITKASTSEVPFDIATKGTGTLSVTGDDTVVYLSSGCSGACYVGDAGHGKVEVTGGKLYLRHDGLNNTVLYLASSAGGKSTWRISGGLLDCNIPTRVWRGAFDYLQSGGSVNFSSGFQMAGASGGSGKSVSFKMTGGTFSASASISVGTGAPQNFTVSISGDSVMNIPGLVGGTLGTRAFSANGCVFRPTAATTAFLKGFNTAALGEAGVTFDTAYDITVAQDFTGLADAANYGTIVKNGAGALTLTGALCENVRLMVNKGRVVLNGSVDPTTTVTAVGGTLEINVPATLAALTIGDGTTNGNLILGAGVELIVTGEVKGSLDNSECDFVVTKDDSGHTHIVRDSSPVTTLEIRLDEEGATSNATESITFKQADTLAVSVASNATLNMSGLYKRGALTKDGAGAAVLTNPDNLLLGGVTCLAGRLAANPFSAFGLLEAVNPSLTLVNGTVELQGDEPIAYAGDFKVNATNSTAAVIIKTDTDVTLRKVTHTQGAIIKRGAGCLTIDPQNRSGTAMVLSRSAGVNATATTSHTFDDANGTVPTTGYGGFNVAEGEFRLANGNFDFQGTTARVGLPLAAEPAAPVVFTVTNSTVKMNASGSNFFFIGNNFNSDAYGQTIRVNVIDSSISGSSAMAIGGYLSAGSSKESIYVGITNSTLTSTWNFCLAHNTNGKTYCNAYKSKLISQCMNLAGYVETILDDCLLAKNTTGSDMYAGISMDNSDHGDSWTRFVGGSEAYISNLGVLGAYGRHTVIFDNATWYPASAMKLRWAANYPIIFFLKTEGQGMTIAKPSDTCRNTFRIEGDGGITKTGAGTFFFDTRSWWSSDQATETKCTSSYGITTWNFTGPVDIQEGVLAVTNGAIAATMSPTVHIAEGATWQLRGDVALANVTVSGSGTVEGGTLTDPTVKVEWKDGKPGNGPVFAGTLAGTATVDFGRTEDNPLGRDSQQCTVARWTGVKPTNVKFRAVNTGLRSKDHFTVNDDGTITADLRPAGMILLVR